MQSDPRMILAPVAEQCLYMRGIFYLAKSGTSGFRTGLRIMKPNEISQCINFAEPEIETCLENLIGSGLWGRDQDGDNVRCLSAIAAEQKRAELTENQADAPEKTHRGTTSTERHCTKNRKTRKPKKNQSRQTWVKMPLLT